jgi:hypothetical protein
MRVSSLGILLALGLATAGVAPAKAATIVVSFEELDGTGVISDGYGGIRWNQNYTVSDRTFEPFLPSSGRSVAYPNYDKLQVGARGSLSFNFDAPVLFEELWLSGREQPVELSFFRDGLLLGSISTMPGVAGAQKVSGWSAPLDQVTITGQAGFWVMDDITFRTDVFSAVPEPNTWAMMLIGFGVIGATMRRRKDLRIPQIA